MSDAALIPVDLPPDADIDAEAAAIEEAYRRRAAEDFFTYLLGLTIPSGRGPRMYAETMAPFQDACFRDLASTLAALRDGDMPPRRRFWIERTKKASKDGDIAASLLWLVAFPKRPLFIQVGAADKDQAAIIKRRITDILHYNPWLAELVDVQTYKIVSNAKPQVVLEIVAADIAGSHGETPDLLVVNELSHVTKWEFVENLLDNADGVPRGVVIIATNAGVKGSKAEMLRKNALANRQKWTVHLWQQPAPWILPADMEDAAARNTKSRYMRLWYGVWASGKGDALDSATIEAIFKPELKPLLRPEPGWMYLVGIDLGVSHDHAGVVVLGVQPMTQRMRVAQMRGFEPLAKTGEVDLIAVEDYIRAVSRMFGAIWVGYDPCQAVLMAQRLRRTGAPCREVAFTGKSLTAMAEGIKLVLENGILESFDDPEGRLRRDLGKLNIVEKSYGYKLESLSDETGHADVGTALIICLPKAIEMCQLGGMGLLQKDDKAAYDDDDAEDLSDDEVDDMPEELREIYQMDDGDD